ncbi:MAG TPA: hypothetical protein VF121_00410 [Thermoanaerobaculia bacterium]|nr:hypothetical protein [Thermoanaerobaculia bacterium]
MAVWLSLLSGCGLVGTGRAGWTARRAAGCVGWVGRVGRGAAERFGAAALATAAARIGLATALTSLRSLPLALLAAGLAAVFAAGRLGFTGRDGFAVFFAGLRCALFVVLVGWLVLAVFVVLPGFAAFVAFDVFGVLEARLAFGVEGLPGFAAFVRVLFAGLAACLGLVALVPLVALAGFGFGFGALTVFFAGFAGRAGARDFAGFLFAWVLATVALLCRAAQTSPR